MGPVNGQSGSISSASQRQQPEKKERKAGGAGQSVSGRGARRGFQTLSTRRIQRDPELKKWSAIAQGTLEILDKRMFSLNGKTVDLGLAIGRCINDTVYYGPEEEHSLQPMGHACAAARIEVTQETSLEACSRIFAQEQQKKRSDPGIACLNFASAVSPGGMFLDGTNTQEDCLARSSALYATLISEQGTAIYEYNRARQNKVRGLHSDAMVFSPDVPVFRDDAGNLREPYQVSFITAPAVDRSFCAGVPEQDIQDTMRRRARKIFAVAANHGVRHLVLGAWGCGVFSNSGTDVAKLFSELLAEDDIKNRFVSVTFPMTDPALLVVFSDHLFAA